MQTIMNETIYRKKSVGVLMSRKGGVDSMRGFLKIIIIIGGIEGELMINSLWAGRVLSCSGLM